MEELDAFVEDIEEDDLGGNWGRFSLDILRDFGDGLNFPFSRKLKRKI